MRPERRRRCEQSLLGASMPESALGGEILTPAGSYQVNGIPVRLDFGGVPRLHPRVDDDRACVADVVVAGSDVFGEDVRRRIETRPSSPEELLCRASKLDAVMQDNERPVIESP